MSKEKHPYQNKAEKFYVAIDAIIFGLEEKDLKVLLIKRDFPPHKGMNSLIGGFPYKEESLDDAAKRILEELTGLSNIYMEQLYAFGDVNRDTAGRTVSIAYFALVRKTSIQEKHIKKNGATWHNIKALPTLIFDHKKMISMAIETLQTNCKTQPIGFELLDKKFTFPQFQKLYELIYNKEIDKRNFRKKVEQMNLLTRLNEKDKKNSKKGAFLYTFNYEKYKNFQQKKIHLDV